MVQETIFHFLFKSKTLSEYEYTSPINKMVIKTFHLMIRTVSPVTFSHIQVAFTQNKSIVLFFW